MERGPNSSTSDGEYGFVSDDYEVVSLEYPSSLPYMMRDD